MVTHRRLKIKLFIISATLAVQLKRNRAEGEEMLMAFSECQLL
jgi:hypothetical protein